MHSPLIEAEARREMEDALGGINTRDPSLLLLNRLRPPIFWLGFSLEDAKVPPLRKMLIASKLSQVLYRKKQLWFMLGSVLRGKTSTAGSILEGSERINRRFGLPDDVWLEWQEDQLVAKKEGSVPEHLTSGPKNQEGCYGDREYAIFNQHYDVSIDRAQEIADFVLSDSTHFADRGEYAFEKRTLRSEKGDDTQVNGVYVSANKDIFNFVVGIREGVQNYPELLEDIIRGEGFSLPPGPFKVRGGGIIPTFEYLIQEFKRYEELLAKKAIRHPTYRNCLQFFISMYHDPDKLLEFLETTFVPYLAETYPMDRFTAVRNRFFHDERGNPRVPPGYSIMEARNLHKN